MLHLKTMAAFLLLSAISFAQTISSVTIPATGDRATCQISGFATGGLYDFGLGPNNDPDTGNPKVVFTVVSLGYDATGAATTITRKVVGTAPMRNPYSLTGAQFTKAESGSSPVTVTFSLNEPIYAKDKSGGGNSGTDPTVTFLSGFYTSSGTPSSAASNLAVTNNSTLSYPKVVANWSRPFNDKVGITANPGVVAFHKFGSINGKHGCPVACVKITATDGTHPSTITLTRPIYDAAYGDAVPVCEYTGAINTSSLTQGATGSFDFQAYPWVGDSTCVIDTTAGTSGNSPLYGTRNFVCDPNGTYSAAIYYVDAGGNDSNAGTAIAPFATIAKAITAVEAYNVTNYSRASCDGGTIYLGPLGGSQSFAWLGGAAPTYGATTMKCNLLIAAAPGQVASNININSSLTSNWAGLLIKLQNVTIALGSGVGGVGCFAPTNAANCTVWFDKCIVSNSSSPLVYRANCWHVTRCTVGTLNQGISPFGTENTAPSIIRGNTFTGTYSSASWYAYTFLGNSKTNATAVTVHDLIASSGTPGQTNTIVAFNYLTTSSTSNPVIGLRLSGSETNGLAVVQNIFECTQSGSAACVQIAADSSTIYGPINNVIFWNNVCVGQRLNINYDENGADSITNAGIRTNWSVKGNICDNRNQKTDTFTGNSASASITGTTVTVTQAYHSYQTGDTVYIAGAVPSGYNGSYVVAVTNANVFTFTATNVGAITTPPPIAPHPSRVNNWQGLYGVGWSGNAFPETTGIGVAGSFMPDFGGLKTVGPLTAYTNQLPTSQPPGCTPSALAWIGFKNRKSYNGSNGSGNGDYSLLPASPAINNQSDILIPIDFSGWPRAAQDASGAYSSRRQRAMTLSF